MSYHDVTHDCGHAKTLKLEGKNVRGAHERKAEWIAKQPCDDCQFTARVTTARNGKTDKDQRLVPLTSGSDKQVAWAYSIRADTIRHIDGSLKPSVEKQKQRSPENADKLDELLTTINQLVTELEAKWWIDNRSSLDGSVSTDTLREMALKRMD